MVKRFIEWRRKGGGGKGSKVASDVPVAVQGRVMLLNLANQNLVLFLSASRFWPPKSSVKFSSFDLLIGTQLFFGLFDL